MSEKLETYIQMRERHLAECRQMEERGPVMDTAREVAFALRDKELIRSIANDIPDVTVERWAKRVALALDEARKAEAGMWYRNGDDSDEEWKRWAERRLAELDRAIAAALEKAGKP